MAGHETSTFGWWVECSTTLLWPLANSSINKYLPFPHCWTQNLNLQMMGWVLYHTVLTTGQSTINIIFTIPLWLDMKPQPWEDKSSVLSLWVPFHWSAFSSKQLLLWPPTNSTISICLPFPMAEHDPSNLGWWVESSMKPLWPLANSIINIIFTIPMPGHKDSTLGR